LLVEAAAVQQEQMIRALAVLALEGYLQARYLLLQIVHTQLLLALAALLVLVGQAVLVLRVLTALIHPRFH